MRRAIRARVLICWEQITLRFNSSGGTHISEGVAGDICLGEQKIRGNTYLRYTGKSDLVRWYFAFAAAKRNTPQLGIHRSIAILLLFLREGLSRQ